VDALPLFSTIFQLYCDSHLYDPILVVETGVPGENHRPAKGHKHIHQHYNYTVTGSSIGRGNQITRRKPPTCCRSQTLSTILVILRQLYRWRQPEYNVKKTTNLLQVTYTFNNITVT
jgi:hypothetical protein